MLVLSIFDWMIHDHFLKGMLEKNTIYAKSNMQNQAIIDFTKKWYGKGMFEKNTERTFYKYR